MRQSRKEAKLEWLIKEGLYPDRREALTWAEQTQSEFAGEDSAGPAVGGALGRRHPPAGRG